jgi:hypothetical protein
VSVGRILDDADALQVDLYLESLLAARGRGPRLVDGLGLDAEERAVAELLAARAVRFHPSFRFEEALAARLRGRGGEGSASPRAAADAGATGVAGTPGTVTRLPTAVAVLLPQRPSDARRRVLIGGAIASGVSLAGAAFVAWRVGTTPRTPFGRAARAAHHGRHAKLRAHA